MLVGRAHGHQAVRSLKPLRRASIETLAFRRIHRWLDRGRYLREA